VTGPEADAAARLLERLLTDPVLRKRFRHDPVAASREAGVESLAQEMSLAAGKAMETLDGRESRSSLAGVFMAAAVEGLAGYELAGDALPHLDEIPEAVGRVLSRVDLPAIPGLEVESAQAAPPDNAAGEFKAVLPEVHAAGAGEGVDPAQFGQEGTGGPAPAEDVALLDNKRVTLDADGIADLKAGKIDPRVASVLTAISRDHEITVSAMMSDHDKLTSGGSISNHYYGRAFDIATVDGQPVNPGNQAAQEVAVALTRLPSGIRPTEIGSPWALPGSADFTDSAHQDHIHVGFDDPISPSWTAPEQLAPSGTSQDFPDDASQDDASQDDGSQDDGSQDVAEPAVALAGEDDDGGDDEPGGLEDPGGDTDAEADEESDGDGGDEEDAEDGADEASDDESDDEEDEDEDEEDDGDEADGDHDDSSDSGSDDTDDSDGSDGGGSDDSGSIDGGGGDDSGSSGSVPDDSGAPLDLGDVSGSYPGDNASQAEMAAWMGSAAQKRGLPPELPVMAGLVESNLRNLNYGDADSVGFFQMRVSIWNQGDYAGYPNNPELQLKWFLDKAVAVKRQGGGSSDPSGYGEWVANVENPAAQYRARYQLRLEEARNLLKEGMGSRNGGGGGDDGLQVEQVAEGGGGSAGRRAVAAVAEAKKYLGTPYQWGGSTPQTGFDCSGLVQWAYAKAGVRIPRTTYDQVDAPNGKRVGRAHLMPGDLIFFRSASGDVHHVGMSVGGDKFINAPSTGEKVRIDSLKEPYYANEFYVARRFDFSRGGGEPRAPAESTAAPAEEGHAPGVDPDAAREAEAALARDAAEVQRPGTMLWTAVRAQEARKPNADAGLYQAVRPGR